MRVPSARELLEIWDAGSGRDHTSRALLMLECARIAPDGGEIADLSIGTRDGLLLDLRERLFGSRIEALEQCPVCGSRLEIAFDVDDIRVDVPETAADRLSLAIDGFEIAARLPTSRDLLAVCSSRDIDEVRAELLARSLLDVNGAGSEMTARELPDAIRDQIAAALGDADPQADVELELECAACAHCWRTHFDIVEYLWSEIEQFGRRTLRDVHLLARSYGWSEDAVLCLSPRRRRFYLEMITNG